MPVLLVGNNNKAGCVQKYFLLFINQVLQFVMQRQNKEHKKAHQALEFRFELIHLILFSQSFIFIFSYLAKV